MAEIIRNTLAPGIFVYPGISHGIENIEDKLKNLEWDVHYKQRNGEDFRKNFEIYLGLDTEIGSALQHAATPCIKDYVSEFKCPTDVYMDWQVMKYEEGHYIGDHTDDTPSTSRKFALTYYLNEDYEGGDLYFKYFDVRYKAKTNDIIIFPANYVYIHRVDPVTSGVRYVGVQRGIDIRSLKAVEENRGASY